MAEQPISVTVDGIAATLQALTLASHNLERYKSLYAGGPDGGYSAGFRNSLDYSLRLFEVNLTRLQAELRDLRNAVKTVGDEFIDLDSEYGQEYAQVDAQLSAAGGDTAAAQQSSKLSDQLTSAVRPVTPPRNAV